MIRNKGIFRRSSCIGTSSNRSSSGSESKADALLIPAGVVKKDKYFAKLALILLLGLGAYNSVIYFGSRPIPPLDFHPIFNVGQQLLSFHLPTSFTRTPIVGILQACLSYLMGNRFPVFAGGWLLNALLYPINLVLLWLIGRKIVGHGALWIAIIVAINPWVIDMLRQPLIETTLLFFILVTFLFIFNKSRWSYLFASITTMVRYEGAALILAAFVIDVISRKSKRERMTALLYASLASLPLVIWMLATIINWEGQGSGHYLKLIGVNRGGESVLVKYLEMLWRTGFSSLFWIWPKAARTTREMAISLSKLVAVIAFIFGAICALSKRRWDILSLLIFFILYCIIQIIYSFVVPRYFVPIFWIAILVCWYGLLNFFDFMNKGNRIPKIIVIILEGVILIIFLVWLIGLVNYLPDLAQISPISASIPYIAMIVVALLLILKTAIYRFKFFYCDLVAVTVVCLIIVSNQFNLARVIRTGYHDTEFIHLARWFLANARPGEKIVTTRPDIMRMFAPDHKNLFVSTMSLRSASQSELIRKFYREGVTYIAWDTRFCAHPDSYVYKLNHMENLTDLAQSRDVGPFEFVFRITREDNKKVYINIFRLRSEPSIEFLDGAKSSPGYSRENSED